MGVSTTKINEGGGQGARYEEMGAWGKQDGRNGRHWERNRNGEREIRRRGPGGTST